MDLKELYFEAIRGKHQPLILLIQFLVYEKKVLTFEDSIKKMDYFLQNNFKNSMNEHLKSYQERLNSQKVRA